jgi:deoxyribose-phosphate aldolase
MHIASYIDHTILKPATTHIEISKICKEAIQYGFAAVCIPPPLVRQAREILSGKVEISGAIPGRLLPEAPVKVATVIGFPFGYSTGKAKIAEVIEAIADGADELDVVINLIALKNGEWEYLEWEIQAVLDQVHSRGKIIKVIIESGILSEEEIIRCCNIFGRMGVDFVKTSTGYAEKGAAIGAVQLMRQHLPPSVRIKASGGIRQYAFARQLIEAGADRLGCSASVEIVKEEAQPVVSGQRLESEQHPESRQPRESGQPLESGHGVKRKARSADNDWETGGEG